METSIAASIALLPPSERSRALLDLVAGDTKARDELIWKWRFWARPEQLPPPGDWSTWLVLAGRGFGKTRAGAEWVRAKVESKKVSRVAIVGPTADDVRDAIIEGESGLLAVSPPWFQPVYEPSKRRVTWPNGAHAELYSAEEPERLRNKQHEIAWCDEQRAWRHPQDTWDNLSFGLRLGENPQAMVTTTPRPYPLLRQLLKDKNTVVTRGSTFDNAGNLSAKFLETVRKRYEGTRLGRQEIHAELLEDLEGALWTLGLLDGTRVPKPPDDLQRIVVGVDPSGGSSEENDEQGIVVDGKGVDGHLYILADRSCRMSPDGWGRRAVQAYRDFSGDVIVYEKNFGGDMVEHVIRTAAKAMNTSVVLEGVTASRGKRVRAEPIAALWEQKRAHIVGSMPELEDQLLGFTPEGMEKSPDRADGMIWAASAMMLEEDWAFA